MSMKLILKLGDIFTIPLNDIEVGFGQVVTNPRKISGGFIIAVFNIKSIMKVNYQVCNLITDQPLFLGHTMMS
jgi:Immunity protein 26